MKPETLSLIALSDKPYDEYNTVLPVIKARLGADRAAIFERVLAEELPLSTARRAYRTAIKVALGEEVTREFEENQKKNAGNLKR
jgi:hypothetical protein